MNTSQTRWESEFGAPIIARRLEQVSKHAPGKLNLFLRVYRRQATPRQAIKATCLDCMGLIENEIRECSSKACPLWSLRPYTQHQTADASKTTTEMADDLFGQGE